MLSLSPSLSLSLVLSSKESNDKALPHRFTFASVSAVFAARGTLPRIHRALHTQSAPGGQFRDRIFPKLSLTLFCAITLSTWFDPLSRPPEAILALRMCVRTCGRANLCSSCFVKISTFRLPQPTTHTHTHILLTQWSHCSVHRQTQDSSLSLISTQKLACVRVTVAVPTNKRRGENTHTLNGLLLATPLSNTTPSPSTHRRNSQCGYRESFKATSKPTNARTQKGKKRGMRRRDEKDAKGRLSSSKKQQSENLEKKTRGREGNKKNLHPSS